MTETRAYYRDRMPAPLPVKRKPQPKVKPVPVEDPVEFDDHVKAWRLVCQAREEGWRGATFFRANCALYGVDPVRVRNVRGGKKVEFVRFAIMNRTHGAYPHLSSSQLGTVFDRDHSTVLYHLGKTAQKPSFLKRKSQQ